MNLDSAAGEILKHISEKYNLLRKNLIFIQTKRGKLRIGNFLIISCFPYPAFGNQEIDRKFPARKKGNQEIKNGTRKFPYFLTLKGTLPVQEITLHRK